MRYADFTEYEGEYYRGVPHGYGKMVQYDHQDGKKVEGAPCEGLRPGRPPNSST
ncbi:unnamed protein product [Effrenium voratum]|nr:unnamed protein product [Effrenium voratum]